MLLNTRIYSKRLINSPDIGTITVRGYELMEKKVSGDHTIADPENGQESWRAAAEKLTQLNSIIRHDLLNQLTILIGFLQYSEDMIEDPQIKAFVQKEETAGMNIQALVEFTREYQDLVLKEPAWIFLPDIVRDGLFPISFNNVSVENSVPDIEIFAFSLIEKVFFIMAENSMKHAKGISRIILSTSAGDDDALSILVEDDGAGIPEEERDMLFERGHGRNAGYGLWMAGEILSVTGITLTENGGKGNGARFVMGVPKAGWRSAKRA